MDNSISRLISASGPLLRREGFKSISVSEKRHGLNLPSAVNRKRLHSLQKWLLIGLINPTIPDAPSNLKYRAGPDFFIFAGIRVPMRSTRDCISSDEINFSRF